MPEPARRPRLVDPSQSGQYAKIVVSQGEVIPADDLAAADIISVNAVRLRVVRDDGKEEWCLVYPQRIDDALHMILVEDDGETSHVFKLKRPPRSYSLNP